MSKILPAGFVFLLGYLLGSIPFGYILVKKKLGKDIREMGSGNIGATNVSRVLDNVWWGRFVLLLDVLKGFVSVVIAGLFWGISFAVLSGIGAVLGHIFPIYIGFRGGKGVAVGIGVFLGIGLWERVVWLSLLCGVILWLVAYKILGYVSVGSILLAMSIGVAAVLSNNLSVRLLCVLVSILIIYRHRENIRRLLSGQEKKTRL